MYIRIYFGEKPVYLCDELDENLKEILKHPDAVFIDEFSTAAINSLLHEIKKPDFHAGVIQHTDLKALKKSFFKHFTDIEAAGGIVLNEHKDILFIERLGKWDLPKGKVEAGENDQEAAVREVEEETGVTQLTVHKKVGETYHTYDAYGKHFIKTTHWYYMTCEGKQVLTPQTEESITAISWIKTRKIAEPLGNTYPNIRDILSKFFDEP
jgi:8-oxo-dGTP pyrophosphatase MutT (NUDIX family)